MTTVAPGGPAAYHSSVADKARYLCKLGLTDDELALHLGLPLETILEWQRSIPEFADALLVGRVLGDGMVADGLFRRAVGASHDAVRIFMPAGTTEAIKVDYTRHYPPETPACKFWLINRRSQNWRARIAIEKVRNDDEDRYSDEELEAFIRQDGGHLAAVPKGRPS